MRTREKLTIEEKFALALELIKRERNLAEIQSHYRVSHTTAYKIRNAFLEGGRAALSGERKARDANNLEARVTALEALLGNGRRGALRKSSAPLKASAMGADTPQDGSHEQSASK